jgi:hypothetical protein
MIVMLIQDISTQGSKFPKTLVIRNTVGGWIWQIYHVDSDLQALYLAETAKSNGFEGRTLEDYHGGEETFPNWRMEMARELVTLLPTHLVLKEDAVDVPTDEDEPDYDSAGYTEADR